jgi:hydroxymethylbilane synthase
VGAYLKRAAVNDLLLVRPDGHDPARIFPVKDGCATGATALRRQSLLKFYAPQAGAVMLRGNVPTRVRKVKEGEFGAIIIAKAGVERLKLDVKGLLVYELNAEVWLPAPGQGAIAVEVRADNKQALELLAKIGDPATRDAVYLERKLLSNFEGGCHTAFGAYARPRAGGWKIIVGMEHQDLIWVETTIVCSFAECEKHGPKTLADLKTHPVNRQEDLCRQIEL